MAKEQRFFQWLIGEKEGEVSVLDYIFQEDGEYYYSFTDGEACAVEFISPMTKNITELQNKILVEIPSRKSLWTFKTIEMEKRLAATDGGQEALIDVPPIEEITGGKVSADGKNIDVENSVLGKRKIIPPKYSGNMRPLPEIEKWLKSDEPVEQKTAVEQPVAMTPEEMMKKLKEMGYNVSENGTPQSEVTVVPEPIKEEATPIPATPVVPAPEPVVEKPRPWANHPAVILAETSKKHETDIELTLTIKLPSKSVYLMAEEEFENGGEIFIDYLVSNISSEVIIESLKDAIKAGYTAPA